MIPIIVLVAILLLVTVLNPALELISLSVDSTCFGDTAQVDVADQGLVSEYLWTPSAGLSDSSIRLPIFTPQVTTTYTLQVTNYCYGDLDSIRIEVLLCRLSQYLISILYVLMPCLTSCLLLLAMMDIPG